jgi:hypothetical protein
VGMASLVFRVLITTAFVVVVGLLAIRKYGQYRRNNANNNYVNYLNRKRGGGAGSPTRKISVYRKVLRSPGGISTRMALAMQACRTTRG